MRSTFLILTAIGYPEYSSKKSKKMYSDHAKVGLLILTEYLGKSFEEFTKILPSLRGVIKAAGISGIPDGSTLRKFRKRLDPAILDKVVACQTRMTIGDSEVTVAIDATGFSTSHASKYYISRLKYFGTEETVIRGYTKVSLAVCVNTKMIIAADTVNTRAADITRLNVIVDKLRESEVPISCVLADKGYDAEHAHRYIREQLNAESIIPLRDMTEPAKGTERRRTSGFYRGLMKTFFDKVRYNMRSIVETVNSMIKGVLGEVLDGRNPDTRHSETMFRCIAHNFRVGTELSGSWAKV